MIFVTGNESKIKEASKYLNFKAVDFDLAEIQSMDAHSVIKHKVDEAQKVFNESLFIEDSSFYLHCLNEFPGPLGKWFLNSLGLDGILNLCQKYNNYGITCVSKVGYHDGENNFYFSGIVDGILSTTNRVDGVFGSLVIPDGETKSLYELTGVSHRSQSFMQLAKWLEG